MLMNLFVIKFSFHFYSIFKNKILFFLYLILNLFLVSGCYIRFSQESLDSNSGSNGNNSSIDGTSLKINSIKFLVGDGMYTMNDVIDIEVRFSKVITISNTNNSLNSMPFIELNTISQFNSSAISKANYLTGSGTDTLVFRYIVSNGDISSDLNYKDTSALNSNQSLFDGDQSISSLTLPA